MSNPDSLFIQPLNLLLFLGLAAFLLFILGVAASSVPKFKGSILVGTASIIAVATSIVLVLASVFAATASARANQTQWLRDEYGITVDSAQVKELGFPEQRPETDSASFGITQVAWGREVLTVHLIWEDNKFELLGTDGEPLKPLPRAE